MLCNNNSFIICFIKYVDKTTILQGPIGWF